MPEPKNLQVLKIAPDQLIPTMRSYNAALGVKCDFCHVEGNFASDDKRHKQIARHMITMTQGINEQFFKGNARVACFTCHHGEEEPKGAPGAAAHEEHEHEHGDEKK